MSQSLTLYQDSRRDGTPFVGEMPVRDEVEFLAVEYGPDETILVCKVLSVIDQSASVVVPVQVESFEHRGDSVVLVGLCPDFSAGIIPSSNALTVKTTAILQLR